MEDLASVPTGIGASVAASLPAAHTSTTCVQTLPPVLPQDPPVLQDFDALINNEVKRFAALSSEIGGLAAEQVSSCISPHTTPSDHFSRATSLRDASLSRENSC